MLDNQGGDLDRKLSEHNDRTVTLFAEHTQDLDARAAARTQQVAESLEGLLGRIDSALDGRAQALHETLAARTLEIARVLNDGGREVSEALEARAEVINAELVQQIAAFTENFADKASEARELLSAGTADVGDLLVARAEVIHAELAQQIAAFTENFADKASEARNC